MACYQPETVAQFGAIVEDICRALRGEGAAVSPWIAQALALRAIELYECGISDPDQLRLDLMADALWAERLLESTPGV
jgi:hypothetical protein